MRILWSFIFTLLVLNLSHVSAKSLLQEMDFHAGDWALVGVPLHNYNLLPVQQELGTFITKDIQFLDNLKTDWDFESTYEDDCDYHYALKFYQNKVLVKTLMLNLHCGYVTVDGFSYAFDAREIERFRTEAEEIAWSRISFSDLGVLQKAIKTLNKTPNVYWYQDVKQYEYDGFFMLSLNQLPWNTNLDSLQNQVNMAIERKTGKSNFYLQEYYHIVQGDKMSVRYLVNCDEKLGDKLSSYAAIPWRSHLHTQDSVRILAIGVDREGYFKLMRD